MEREASPWGLEPGDVQSPDEVGSPEGSLKGEGGSAFPRSVPGSGSGRGGCGPSGAGERGGLDTWRWEEAGAGTGRPGSAEGEVGISAPALGPATLPEEEGDVCGNEWWDQMTFQAPHYLDFL